MTVRYIKTKDFFTGTIRTDQVRFIGEDGMEWIVPEDPLNYMWAAYQDWLAAGNVPDEPD